MLGFTNSEGTPLYKLKLVNRVQNAPSQARINGEFCNSHNFG